MCRCCVRLVAVGLLLGVSSACYSYRPIVSAPAPSTHVSLVLTDNGRAEAASRIGPQAARVEGAVIEASDSAYVLAVSAVQPITGSLVRWSGETVSVRRDQVAWMYERRLSRSRTAVFAGIAAGVLTLAISTNLFGIAGNDVPVIPPGDGGGQDQ